MYNIEMLNTIDGANDGIRVVSYKKGQQYTIGKSLYASFMKMGVCKLVEKKMVAPSIENKMLQKYTIGKSLYASFMKMGVCKLVEKKMVAPSIENKMLQNPVENKNIRTTTKKRKSRKK